jgi:hypothetical protein
MSQLTIKLSDKADALIAQLQKEIFNRRRKKVSPAGVVETLVESGAKSQSDRRFAASWINLIADIERAAKLADAHGSKPANLTDEEWAMVLNHRSRTPRAKPAAKAMATKPRAQATVKKTLAKKPAVNKPLAGLVSTAKPAACNPVRNSVRKKSSRGSTVKPQATVASKGLVAGG